MRATDGDPRPPLAGASLHDDDEDACRGVPAQPEDRDDDGVRPQRVLQARLLAHAPEGLGVAQDEGGVLEDLRRGRDEERGKLSEGG